VGSPACSQVAPPSIVRRRDTSPTAHPFRSSVKSSE
jgi:hypothetical protein